MRLCILLIALISTTVALENAQRTARTPQAQIKYNDPNGSKVDWKLFGLQTQGRTQLENSQRKQRGQTEYTYPQQAIQRPVQPQVVQQHELDPAQYKATYQQQQSAQPDPNQYKGYSQSQPEVLYKPPVQYQYKPYQHSQAPIDAQPAPIQIQYKTFAQPQSRVDAQQDPNQLQYKVYQQSQAQAEAQTEQNQIQYKYRPISEVPGHVKQLVLDNFKPQRPYVDHTAFLYTTNYAAPQQHDQQSANADLASYEQPSEGYEQEQQKTRREYSDRGLQGRIVYKDNYKQGEDVQPQPDYLQVPIEKLPIPSAPKLVFDKSMPPEIQQLLQYQTQLPYDVIANSITYKPKSVFIPKPLPADASGPYQYRSKVYYRNINDEYEPEYDESKPVQEEQRH
nr:adenylate cyclase, terminal-differentiation specific-like [Nomia melanderi]